MDLDKFIVRFLPDYERLLQEEVIGHQSTFNQVDCYNTFKKRHFPEALQNFANRICEEQRRLCCNCYNNEQPYESHRNDIANLILEADQPKIESL